MVLALVTLVVAVVYAEFPTNAEGASNTTGKDPKLSGLSLS